MPWIAAIAAVAGGAMGAMNSAAARKSAIEANQKAVQEWMDVHVPDPEQQKIALQRYVSSGEFTPQLQKAIKADPSAMQAVHGSDQGKQAQLQALSSLQSEGLHGGLDIRDQAALQGAENDAATRAHGRADTIQSNMAQRGLGGSGLALAAQMGNAQNANQIDASNSLNAAASSRQRALDSIMGAGQLGGQINAQQYGEQANLAKAQDAINTFNTQNAQNVSNTNVGLNNSANMYNLQNKQNISNANTDMSNKEQLYNKNLYQQDFQNRMGLASGRANAQVGAANNYNQQADRTAQQWAGVGSGVGQAANAWQQSKNYQDRTNAIKDKTEDDASAWMGNN